MSEAHGSSSGSGPAQDNGERRPPGQGAAQPSAPPGAGSEGPPAEPGSGAEAGHADDVLAIAGLRAELAEARDLRLRALADADNARKRCAGQVQRAEAGAEAHVARLWLPVLDNLERALAHAQAEPTSIIEGVQAVREQALDVLARLGFSRRDDYGAAFDPARHDAVASRAVPGAEPGTVVEVLAPGYGEGDHQLRPAQVVVAVGD